MKIYTKKGDKGTTSLIGGVRVPKHHVRIESYGTVDELNSWVGVIRDQDIDEKTREKLIKIQNELFVIGSMLASSPEKSEMKVPEIKVEDILHLEKEIDIMNEELPEMRFFVLPGGHQVVSYCHVARCVCRRSERLTVQLQEDEFVNDLVLQYLNRLSDYLFVLSRKFTQDFDVKETPWKSGV